MHKNSSRRPGLGYTLPCGEKVCKAAFRKVLCVGNERIRRLERSLKDKDTHRQLSTWEGNLCREWMDTFFLSHLKDNLTRGYITYHHLLQKWKCINVTKKIY